MGKNEDLFPPLTALLRQLPGHIIHPDAHTLLDMMAENIVFEFPYAPPDGVRVVKGKAALADYLRGVSGLFTIESMTLSRAILSACQQTAVLEFSCRGRLRADGRPYCQDYISVIDSQDRRIVRYRDYWNPLALLPAGSQPQTGGPHAE